MAWLLLQWPLSCCRYCCSGGGGGAAPLGRCWWQQLAAWLLRISSQEERGVELLVKEVTLKWQQHTRHTQIGGVGMWMQAGTLPKPACAGVWSQRTLMWKTSLWPCSTAFCLLANLSTRSLTSSVPLSPAFSLRLPGLTVYLSLAPGFTVASTAPLSVLVTQTVCV